jgi:hypothetical protein
MGIERKYSRVIMNEAPYREGEKTL